MQVGLKVLAVGVGLAISSSSMAAILSRDFQSDTVGAAPSPSDPAHLDKSAGMRFEVIDASSSPPDQFGGAGNKSLMASNSTTGNYVNYVMDAPAASAVAVGTFSVKFSHVDFGGSSAITSFNLGTYSGSTVLSGVGPALEIFGSSMRVWTSGGPVTLDQTVPFNPALHTIAINFDANTDTFTGTLNGSPLTASSGATTSFGFNQNLTGIHAVLFSTPTTGRIGQTFIDDVVITPEPASAVSALAVLGCVALRRRASGRA